MCGIGGYIARRTIQEPQLIEKLKVINATQARRGPDSHGYYTDPPCGLCHARLSIIDLSEKARQPFISEDEDYVNVYNGEGYPTIRTKFSWFKNFA